MRSRPAHAASRASSCFADVLHRVARRARLADARAGVSVLACPNPRREIEIVAAEIRAHLDADPTLSAHEIGVWIASDAERYLAQAPAAFEAVGVPWHLIDAPIDDRGRIGEAVLALLELPTGDDGAPRSAARDDAPGGARGASARRCRRLGALDRAARHRARRRSRRARGTRTSPSTPVGSTGIRACGGSRSARSCAAKAR